MDSVHVEDNEDHLCKNKKKVDGKKPRDGEDEEDQMKKFKARNCQILTSHQ